MEFYKSKPESWRSPPLTEPLFAAIKQVMNSLRQELEQLSRDWIAHGVPSRETVLSTARFLAAFKQQPTVGRLWSAAPRMLTATLDDGIGQGLDIINTFARIMDIEVIPLGLLQKPEAITAACHDYAPDFLGLTVLQLDSEDDLAQIGRNLPAGTRLIAGGPAFRLDHDLASRCGVHATAASVAHFIHIMLEEHLLREPA
jgi:methylmalonyl-CoA mutase cobalamin-binding subunit